MGELACNMVYVYLAGAWSWLTRATAARERLSYRECTLELGHACSHTPAYPPEMTVVVPPTYAERDRLRLEPDPERDRRREAYKALEREKARRALDAWFQEVDEAGEWQYPGALLVCMNDYGELLLHHKGNYGAPDGTIPECTCPRPYGRSEAPDPFCPQHQPVKLAALHNAPDAAHDERARQRDRERAGGQ